MPFFRCTFGFRTERHGWSETYFCEAQDFVTAAGFCQGLHAQRVKISPAGVKSDFIRCSAVGDRGNARQLPIAQENIQGTFHESGQVPSVNLANDCLLVEYSGANNYRNRKFLRGIPDGQIANDVFIPSAAYGLALFDGGASFLAFLVQSPWRIRAKQRGAAGATVWTTILNYRVVRASTRDTGRPFGLPVGRRRKRPSA